MSSTAAHLARRLSVHAEAVCKYYLSSGRRCGNYWMVGDINNNAGRSLFVRLTGPECGAGAAGKWTDSATGEHGDLLDIIRVNAGLSHFPDVLEEARRFLSEPRHVANAPTGQQTRTRSGSAGRLFAASKPIIGTLAQTYLRGRGITCSLDLASLRYHPTCFQRDNDHATWNDWPAIIAGVTDVSGKLTGVQRTWLARDGSSKAPLATPRRSLGDILGSAIWLGTPGKVCAVGEGLETMLSLKSVMPAMPMAAATSANHLGLIEIPASVERLYIAHDNDAPGHAAAEHLCWRFLDAPLDIRLIGASVDDWNTVLVRHGMSFTRYQVARLLHPEDIPYLEGASP